MKPYKISLQNAECRDVIMGYKGLSTCLFEVSDKMAGLELKCGSSEHWIQ